MGDPKWMAYVKWPSCSDCDSKGFTSVPGEWPAECQRCKAGRERAVIDAQNYRKRELKSGAAR